MADQLPKSPPATPPQAPPPLPSPPGRVIVLIIDKGFGGGIDGPRYQALAGEADLDVELCEVAEPMDDTAIEAGAAVVLARMAQLYQSPHCDQRVVLIASSRGGKIAAHLLSDACKPAAPPLAVLLFSAMSTASACQAARARQSIDRLLLVHGSDDGINPIDRVRRDAAAGSAHHHLAEFTGANHSLHAATPRLPAFVRELADADVFASMPPHRRGEDDAPMVAPLEEAAAPPTPFGFCQTCHASCATHGASVRHRCPCGHYRSAHQAAASPEIHLEMDSPPM